MSPVKPLPTCPSPFPCHVPPPFPPSRSLCPLFFKLSRPLLSFSTSPRPSFSFSLAILNVTRECNPIHATLFLSCSASRYIPSRLTHAIVFSSLLPLMPHGDFPPSSASTPPSVSPRHCASFHLEPPHSLSLFSTTTHATILSRSFRFPNSTFAEIF